MAGYHHGQPGPGSAGLGLPRQSMLESGLGFLLLLAMAKGREGPSQCQSSSLSSGEPKPCSPGTGTTVLGSAALPAFSTLHWFPARQAFILEIRAVTFLSFRKKHPFSSIITAQIINITNSRAVRGCQSPAAAWCLTSAKPTSLCHITVPGCAEGTILHRAHRVAGGAGPLLPHVLLLSGGQGAPHKAKDTPCKVWRAYLKDPAMKVVVHTHTTIHECCRGESMVTKAPSVAQSGASKAPGGPQVPGSLHWPS